MPQTVEVPGFGDVEFPDGMSDDQITAAIQKNMAPQMPAAKPFPDVYGGAGGFNPLQNMLGGSAQRIGESLGMTPENTANPVANAAGPGETALQLLTGGLAMPIAGLAGLMTYDRSGKTSRADTVRNVQDALTYQPRTGAGQGMSRTASAPMEAYGSATNKAGEFVVDKTGLPSLGAAVKTAADVAPSLLFRGQGSQQRTPSGPRVNYKPVKDEIPTTEQLKKASQHEYALAKESGVMVEPDAYGQALAKVRTMATEEGINPTLHPKSTAVLKELENSAGKPLTLQEAETLRKIALDAEDDLNPVTRQPTPDSRLAGKIVDELDESIEALSANDKARALWARSRRSQMVDQMVHRAEIKAGAHYTQAGMEHALRQEFKQLAMNPRRMRGLTKDQRAAIEKVAKGGPLENTLRVLGKFDPSTGGMGTAISLGLGGGFAPMTGGASLALPAVGFGAKRAATKLTSRNVDKAREALVGRGLAPPTAAPLPRAAPMQPTVAPPGLLAPKAARSPANIRADIQKLVHGAGKKGGGPREVAAIYLELQRLQDELALAEGRAGAGGAPSQ